jgi:pyruvate dehydrogenase E2 component (dihydrolipoamide acetyltransferase)
MRIEVAMPRLSDSMSEGSVTAWFKNEGDPVTKGEAIAEIETEKSTVDLPSPESGVLARIVVAAGSGATAVGAVLAEIEAGGVAAESAAMPASAATGSPAPTPASKAGPTSAVSPPTNAKPEPSRSRASIAASTPAPSRSPASDVVSPPPEEGAIPATPLARRMAAQAGLALSSLARSGPGGKVAKADVEAALGRTATSAAAASRATSSMPGPATRPSTAPPTAAPRSAPAALSRMRRTIAERMARAKATIPHFYLSVDCRVDRLLAVRETLKADGLAVSVNDFVMRASALALVRVPEANASWSETEGIVRHDRVDVAVAVAVEEGLVTPVVRGVDGLGLVAIAEQVRDLATRARDGALAPHEYDGATFTVSNLGMHGVGEMFAIINPPQACILGVGAAEARPVVDGGQVVAGTVMTLSLSADHRVLDGVAGARLLAAIRRYLEEPSRMLA